MVEKMAKIDEGGSTLLDNSMLLYTSYMANGGHGTQNYPALLAGKAGGSLKTGRHIAYKKETPMANLYVEMTDAWETAAGNSATANRRQKRRMTDGCRIWCRRVRREFRNLRGQRSEVRGQRSEMQIADFDL